MSMVEIFKRFNAARAKVREVEARIKAEGVEFGSSLHREHVDALDEQSHWGKRSEEAGR